MKQRISRILAITLTVAVLLTIAALPASAATTYTAIGGSTTITKNLVVDSDANIPDITFTYTITRGTPVAATSSTIEILASDVTASIGNAVFSNADTGSTIQGKPSDNTGETTTGKKYAQKSVTVTFPDNSFTKPGVYRYVINEVNGGKPGVTYDTTARYLDVFVVASEDPANPDELSVDSYVLRDTDTPINRNGEYTADPGGKSEGYTNSINQFDFSFSKVIGGNQGDKNKRFTFTLTITNAIPGVYPVVANDVTGSPTSITVASDGTYTGIFELTNASSLKVVSLNEGAICRVSEDAEDYAATHSVDSEASVSGNSTEGINMGADHSVVFTNNRTGVIPTGILLTIAPFAIGLLVFGAIVVYMLARKKKEY